MPKVKSGINSLGQATSKLSFIKVPRLGKPPRYDRWLKHLLATPHNKKAAGACHKADVDLFYRELAIQHFKKDDESLGLAFAEVRSLHTRRETLLTHARQTRWPVKTCGDSLSLNVLPTRPML